MLKYYCYRHIRLDTNQPFYIGIGTTRNQHKTFHSMYARMNSRTDRNSIWSKIVAKTKYIAQVIYESDDIDEIKEKEKEFISLYKRRDNGGTLCNMTDGGDGVIKLPRQTIESIARFNRGTKRKESSIQKMRYSKMLKSKKVLEINSGLIFNCCSDAERYYFSKRNKYIYNALTRTNGIMVKWGLKFKYIN